MGKQKETIKQSYQVRISDNALKNIDEITGYIAFINHEPKNAIKIGDKLFETIERIMLHPYAFKECEELPTKSKMYRSAVCMSWLIIYKINLIEITILGIIHISRRPSKIKILRNVK